MGRPSSSQSGRTAAGPQIQYDQERQELLRTVLKTIYVAEKLTAFGKIAIDVEQATKLVVDVATYQGPTLFPIDEYTRMRDYREFAEDHQVLPTTRREQGVFHKLARRLRLDRGNQFRAFAEYDTVQIIATLKKLGYSHGFRAAVYNHMITKVIRDPKLASAKILKDNGKMQAALKARITRTVSEWKDSQGNSVFDLLRTNPVVYENTVMYLMNWFSIYDYRTNISQPEPEIGAVESVFRMAGRAVKPLTSALRGVSI